MIDFGRYSKDRPLLDFLYDNICEKLERFSDEAGVDPYNRKFDAENLLSFVIRKNISKYSVEFIYREYIYEKLEMLDKNFDRDYAEYQDFLLTFCIV